MTAQEKKYKNLGTYATIMVLAVIILIIIAAMADNREEAFRTQQEETVSTIQSEVDRLSGDNQTIGTENENLKNDNEKLKKEVEFYSSLISAWESYSQGDIKEANEKLLSINKDTLNEEEKTSYDILEKLLKEE